MIAEPMTPVAQATAGQRAAADPAASVWVAASAGSGKTKVLTDRVLSLLLDGAEPQRLLCLTFTKAAAAEMANRLATRLGLWAVCNDPDLAEQLEVLRGRPADDATLSRARALFARVLDAPGGMKIMTIHAFCQSLLARFPLEAGVAPTARVMEDRKAQELLEESRGAVLAGAMADPEGPWAAALEVVTQEAHELTFGELLGDIVRERGRFRRALDEAGGLAGLLKTLERGLGLQGDEDAAALRRGLAAEGAFDRAGLRRVLAALPHGTPADRAKKEPTLSAWLAGDDTAREALLETYADLFFTQEASKPIAQRRRARLLTAGAVKADPAALEALEQEAERLAAGFETLAAIRVAGANRALFTLGAAVLARYETLKAAAALLDYDDLILRAKSLLTERGGCAWVLFKLDGGLDHLLIDEGQDTNPDQWAVVQAITEEFFAGEGQAGAPRSVFVVGDAKQSIYSFQRADPHAFQAMQDHFATRVAAAELAWRRVQLAVSFRSAPAVLRAVDAVFARPEARDGVLFEETALSHIPFRSGQAGLVELWPPAPPAERSSREAWSLPLEESRSSPAHSRLARLLATRIKHWTETGGADDPDCRLSSHGRRIRPEDILILVRRRNVFFEELVRALKLAGVPVAGVDRMILTEQLAVMDLIALGRVMLLPEDDLTLAVVLKSPLIGLDEMQLFALAHGRPGSLWAALREAGQESGGDADMRAAWIRLTALRARADYQAPYEFFARLLGAEGGRERLLARLGPDAADPIEEFLSQALLYGRDRVASLEGFLHWIESGAQQIKRDLEQAKDSVRVMTVHGAKGLQAPIVILPDSLQEPRPAGGVFWLPSSKSSGLRGAESALPFWPLRQALDGALAADARAAARRAQGEEYRRLLYVAMTRAEDRLYVCGWLGQAKPPAGCWHNLVAAGLDGLAEPVAFDFSQEVAEGWSAAGWRLANPGTAGPDGDATLLPATVVTGALPVWTQNPPRPEPAPPLPLMPSRPSPEAPAPRSPLAPDQEAIYRRGILIHRLLQDLPDLPAARRREAGVRLLDAVADDLPAAQRVAMVEECLAVIAAPEHAVLFGPASRAEVPLVGLVEAAGAPQVISGRVDRLAVTDAAVFVVDYKTSRPVPAGPEGVPGAYLGQLAGYRALLAQIYPDRPIHCALLWTDGPRLMQISPASLADQAP